MDSNVIMNAAPGDQAAAIPRRGSTARRVLAGLLMPAITAAIALVALAALVLANVIAALPGRRAARTPAAIVLRAE